MAGNYREWVDWDSVDTFTSGPISCPYSSKGTEFPDVNCGALATAEYLPDNLNGQKPSSYNSDYGLGKFNGGSGGAAIRGGYLNFYAGIFSLALANPPNGYGASISFRCVYRL